MRAFFLVIPVTVRFCAATDYFQENITVLIPEVILRSYKTFKQRSCYKGGTRWCGWLRHCATSWKVAGLIPDGVTGIFH